MLGSVDGEDPEDMTNRQIWSRVACAFALCTMVVAAALLGVPSAWSAHGGSTWSESGNPVLGEMSAYLVNAPTVRTLWRGSGGLPQVRPKRQVHLV